jgi:hypothetical protein
LGQFDFVREAHPPHSRLPCPLARCLRRKGNQPAAAAVAAADPHEAAIREFQGGQQRFKELVAGIRDEKSYDEAAPALDKIVADWKQVAEKLKKLEAPAEAERERYRKMISEGHRLSEPIAKDMIRLVLVESREEQLGRWLKSFTDAGGEAGWELTRLYGMTDYSQDATAPPEFELKLDPLNPPFPKESGDDILRRYGPKDNPLEGGEAPEFELGKVKLDPQPSPILKKAEKADE